MVNSKSKNNKNHSKENKQSKNKENVYYIEKVLEKRIRNGKAEFLIKWQNFDDSNNTWEPESNLSKQTVDEYNNQLFANSIENNVSSSNSKHTPNKETLDSEKYWSEDEYYVEEVLNKRIRNGKAQYLIKWQNFDDSNNTWEPETNLSKTLLDEFNKTNQLKSVSDTRNQDAKQISRSSTSSGNNFCSSDSENSPKESNIEAYITKKRLKEGDECTDTPLKIIGATKITGPIVFLVKFKDSQKFMHASVAKQKYPQMVIEFYESKLNFND